MPFRRVSSPALLLVTFGLCAHLASAQLTTAAPSLGPTLPEQIQLPPNPITNRADGHTLRLFGWVHGGRALLKIPQGTQNGQKFRLREKGVFNSRKNSRGDEIVEVFLKAPDVHDERTRELLRELAQVQTGDVRSEIWSKVQPS